MHLPLSYIFTYLSFSFSLLTLPPFVEGRDVGEQKSRVYFAVSPPKLIFLANLDKQIYTILLNASESGKVYDQTLSRYIKLYLLDYQINMLNYSSGDFPTESDFNPNSLSSKIAYNPITAYRLIKRCELFGSQILPAVKHNLPLRCYWCKLLKNLVRGETLPTVEDEDDAINSILRMQLYHDYSAEDISQGIFGEIDTKTALTEYDMVNIGSYAQFLHVYVYGIEWLELAVLKLQKQLLVKEYNVEEDFQFLNEVEGDLQRFKEEHDLSWEQLKYAGDIRQKINLFVNKVSESNNGDSSKKTHPPRPQVKVADLHRQMYEDFKDEDRDPVPLRFRNLCTGKNYQTLEEKRLLHCWYERKVHPYWNINPLKVEVLHDDPKLLQIYDFVGDHFLKEIKEMADPALTPAATVNLQTLKEEVNSYRVSVNSWLHSRAFSFIKEYYRKVELFTGLKTLKASAGEDLQVAGYTFGGHYEQHYDCLFEEPLIAAYGERMATFMLYMNDVKAGGYTAFPELGTAALPVKGSAVFWYDTMRNGSCDLRLIHGACPVVLGHKYVANMWIHSKENFQSRKCGLDSNK